MSRKSRPLPGDKFKVSAALCPILIAFLFVSPPNRDGTFAKSGESRLKPERNRSNDQKYF